MLVTGMVSTKPSVVLPRQGCVWRPLGMSSCQEEEAESGNGTDQVHGGGAAAHGGTEDAFGCSWSQGSTALYRLLFQFF